MTFKLVSLSEARHQGLTRYYTGVICINGHDSERLTANRTCVKCNNAKTTARKKERYHSDQEYKKKVISKGVERRRKRYQNDPEFRLHLGKLRKKYYSNNPKKYNERSKEWADKNPERRKEIAKNSARKSYLADPKKHKEVAANWRAENQNQVKAIAKKGRKKNAAIINARNGKRRAGKLKATPVWSDDKKIKEIYKEARGQGMHVDHIFPLNSAVVCGLHVHENLQLLTPKENLIKSNNIVEVIF